MTTPSTPIPPLQPPTPTSPLTSLTDGEWHRLYPATPLLRGGIFVVAILGFIVTNLRERLIEFFFQEPSRGGDPIDEIYQRGAVGWALLAVAGVLLVILVVFYLSWRMHTFRVSAEAVEVRSGLVFRSHRKARLDRIQGVNLARAFIPRLFGAARLDVSVGGQDGSVQLAYLSSRLADDLRRDILRLASGSRQTAPPPADAVRPTHVGDFAADRVAEFMAPELNPDAAPPESVVRIPPGRLVGSILLSPFTVFLIVAVIVLIVSVTQGIDGWVLFAILPGIIGSVGYYFSRVTKMLRYSIAGTPDGVRVGYGLLSTTSETLPPGRIHAVGVSQPLLWRPFGWWQVQINKAGHASAQTGTDGATLPVGTPDDVARVLALILPGFTGEQQRALIAAGMTSPGGLDGFTNAPVQARWLRPFSWRRTGYAFSEDVALLRHGIISRNLALVPLARLQSVGISQGPLHRRLHLASARLHTVSGPVTAWLGVIDADESVRLFERVTAAAIASARADTTHHWNEGGPE